MQTVWTTHNNYTEEVCAECTGHKIRLDIDHCTSSHVTMTGLFSVYIRTYIAIICIPYCDTLNLHAARTGQAVWLISYKKYFQTDV